MSTCPTCCGNTKSRRAATIRKFRTVQREGGREVTRDILDHPGKVSQEVAKAFAESEFAKYRIVQDRLLESDFDRHIKKTLEGGTP